MTIRIPLTFHVMKSLMRFSWLARMLARRAARRLDDAARRAIRDPRLRERTLSQPEAGALFRELLLSTIDRVDRRVV
ncbi:MAG: hypothetical protein QM784_11630, partial [Polyangiaceae bacterium]